MFVAYQGVRNVRFSENLACFAFVKHPLWDSPFYFITGEIMQLLLIFLPTDLGVVLGHVKASLPIPIDATTPFGILLNLFFFVSVKLILI